MTLLRGCWAHGGLSPRLVRPGGGVERGTLRVAGPGDLKLASLRRLVKQSPALLDLQAAQHSSDPMTGQFLIQLTSSSRADTSRHNRHCGRPAELHGPSDQHFQGVHFPFQGTLFPDFLAWKNYTCRILVVNFCRNDGVGSFSLAFLFFRS